ncbi:MAG: hypothetical protein SGBAC_004921 [Bacillariaceae sp.]
MSRLPIPSFEGMALLNETNYSYHSEEEDTISITTQPRVENEQSPSTDESKEQRSTNTTTTTTATTTTTTATTATTTARASNKRKRHASSDEESHENYGADPVHSPSSSPSALDKRRKIRRDKRRKESRRDDTQLIFDQGQMKTIDEILATRDWPIQKVLGKRTVGRGSNKRTEYRCQWRNSLETEAMYLALKNYKGIGYKVRVESIQAAAGGAKLYNCCWGALWEPEEHLNSTAINVFERQQEQKKQARKLKKKKHRGYEDV